MTKVIHEMNTLHSSIRRTLECVDQSCTMLLPHAVSSDQITLVVKCLQIVEWLGTRSVPCLHTAGASPCISAQQKMHFSLPVSALILFLCLVDRVCIDRGLCIVTATTGYARCAICGGKPARFLISYGQISALERLRILRSMTSWLGSTSRRWMYR